MKPTSIRVLFPALLVLASAAASGQEKVLNLYSARHYQTDEALYANFTKQTGIKINRIEAKEDELLERIRNEGANSPADIFLTVDAARLAKADDSGEPAQPGLVCLLDPRPRHHCQSRAGKSRGSAELRGSRQPEAQGQGLLPFRQPSLQHLIDGVADRPHG
jgi:hypothetical protein